MSTDVYLHVVDGVVVTVVETGTVVIGNTQVNPVILGGWSDTELADLGLVRAPRIEPADIDWTAELPTVYAPMRLPDGTWAYVLGRRQLTAEEIAAQLTAAKAAKVDALTAAYAAACAQPVSLSVGGMTKTYQADADSAKVIQQTLIGFSAVQATPQGFWWLSSDNTQVPFGYGDLQALAAAMLSQGWDAFQRLQDRKARVRAAESVAEVLAVEW